MTSDQTAPAPPAPAPPAAAPPAPAPPVPDRPAAPPVPDRPAAPPVPDRPPAPDQTDRDLIQQDIANTLFVEAGAGTGKTTALVGRIISLIASGIEIQNIVAITFTEKAASELQSRIRKELQEKIQNKREPRFEVALEELDNAPISTLHSFAQKILSQHALEAGLPLRFSCFDELEGEIQFLQEWEIFQATVLKDPRHAKVLQLAKELKIAEKELKQVFRKFRDNWDLVRAGAQQDPSFGASDLPDISEIQGVLTHLLHAAGDFLVDRGSDRTAAKWFDEKLPRLDKALRSLAARSADEPRFAKELYELASSLKLQDKELSPKTLAKLTHGEATFRLAIRDDVPRKVLEYLQKYLEVIVDYLAAVLSKFTVEQAEERKARGQLIFHDLLVYCLELLRHPNFGPKIRDTLSQRYQRILVDEFQDTDPIQIELVALLASKPSKPDTHTESPTPRSENPTPRSENPTPQDSAQTPRSWRNLKTETGQLFFVGDPKQSIYRFRRANISLYLQAAQHFGPAVSLRANWRSTKPIISWVNQTFDRLIQELPDSQPAYIPLEGSREPAKTDPGPPIAILGADPCGESSEGEKPLSVSDLRALEAEDIAKQIGVIIQSGWLVSLENPSPAEAPHRQARLSDICVLSPNRNNFHALERAFAKHNIPYQVQVGNNIFVTPEIRDLFALLKSVDDPTDQHNIVIALRSTAFGCGDDDLFDFHSRGGKWDYRKALPKALEPTHPVAQSLAWLEQMHQLASMLSPSQIIDQIIEQRSLYELALANSNHRDVWRKLESISELARKFTQAQPRTLRQFIMHLQSLGQNQVRLRENIVPETDFDAVKIMTIHASKGLEFPVVILSNSKNTLGRSARALDITWDDQNQLCFSRKKNFWNRAYADYCEHDKRREKDEDVRLLYVACTRARDHLVVCLHRKETKEDKDSSGQASDGPAGGGQTSGGQASGGPASGSQTSSGQTSQPQDESQLAPMRLIDEYRHQGDLLAAAVPKSTAVSPTGYITKLEKADWQSKETLGVAFDLSQLPGGQHVLGQEAQEVSPPPTTPEQPATPKQPTQLSDFERWQAQIQDARQASHQHRIWSASRIAHVHESSKSASEILDSAEITKPGTPATHEQPTDIENKDMDWQTSRGSSIGRAATNVGSAVHAVLQTFDLRSLGSLTEAELKQTLGDLSNIQAAAFGLYDLEHKQEIAELAKRALDADCVRAASQAQDVWKEIYLSAAFDFGEASQKLLDGCVDLIYRNDDGSFVVVDYKTDNSATMEHFRTKLAKYRLQIAAYALATERTTGEKVDSCVLLFIPRSQHSCLPDIHEVKFDGDNLSEAKREVEEFLAQSPAPTSP